MAPFASLYFDQFGGVRACCANEGHLLGDVTRDSIRTIWRGARAEQLRRALRDGDLSKGCDLCAWQLDHGGRATMARSFDRFGQVGRRTPRWPREMQFSLSNVCNLQCTMCSGDNSSAIRAHREHLPPLPRVYGDRFLRELGPFVDRLSSAKFLGGEPLLGRESLAVMELIAARNPSVAVRVTTNGTVWSERHQRIYDRAPFDISVSIDGLTAATYEAVRVGADHATVFGNLDRFIDLAARHGSFVGINHCLMVGNWHEFGDLLEMAERRNLDLYVNSVLFPVEHSLVQLPLAELREVVDGLAERERGLRLVALRPVWDEQLALLRARVRELERHPGRTTTDPWQERHAVPPGSAASHGAGHPVQLSPPRRRGTVTS